MTTNDNEQLFTTWASQYKGVMLKVVYSFADTVEDQNDLFQEVLLQLWISIASFRQESKESTWIYRVALNTALTWKRGEKRRKDRYRPLIDMEIAAEDKSDDKEEMIKKLYKQIRKLPKVDASLILLSLDGLSYNEMSQITGISESNVGVRLNRIKKKLTDLFKEADNEL